MTLKTYSTAAAFRKSLEHRLRNITDSGLELERERQLLVFHRFLARVVSVFGPNVILKGGLVLELRLERARTTRDIDLRMTGSPTEVFSSLQKAAELDLDDFFFFNVEPDPRHPKIDNEGVQYEGQRYRVECLLGGKIYGQRFGLDVAFGDPLTGEVLQVSAKDQLAFMGVPPPTVALYPVETHVAEKLHAYSMPRTRPNTRVKDLPDLALLASAGKIQAQQLRSALEQTFSFRQTHPIPAELAAPAADWARAYDGMVARDGLPWKTLDEVTEVAKCFLDPILKELDVSVWDPTGWRWE